jgi:YMGG-like Gly-zipper
MKRKSIKGMVLVALWVGGIALAGCATPQNPYIYPGAGIGAAGGAAIGAATNGKNPWKGAAIGGLLGGALGAVGGEVYGRSNPSQPQQGYYQNGPQPGYGYAPNQGYNPAVYGASQPPPNPNYQYGY